MKYKSEQERRVLFVSRWAIGQPNVFAPQLYKSARGNDEPCDLAWVYERGVTLFYSHQPMPKAVRPGARSAFDRSVEHNLRQAKKWLKRWAGDPSFGSKPLPLQGDNEYGDFELHRHDQKTIGVISIVNCEGECSIYHENETLGFGVSFVISIPEQVLGKFLNSGANQVDISNLVHALKTDGTWTLAKSLEWIANYVTEAWRTSGASLIWPENLKDPQYWDIYNAFHTHRSVRRKDHDQVGFPRYLDDISLPGLLSLVATMRLQLDKILQDRRFYRWPSVTEVNQVIDREISLSRYFDNQGYTVLSATIPEHSQQYLSAYEQRGTSQEAVRWATLATTKGRASTIEIDGHRICVAFYDLNSPPSTSEDLSEIINANADLIIVTVVTGIGLNTLFAYKQSA